MLHRLRLGLASAAIMATGACSSSPTPETSATRAFRRWNKLALAGDPKASSVICNKPEPPDGVHDPITTLTKGFADPGALNTGVDGDRAIVDFRFVDRATDQESDIFITLRLEGGKWKVCAVQETAPGGIG